MKLMASGVTCSAARVRSPSFSRSLVVDHNHHAAGANLGQRAGNVGERGLEVRGVCGITAPFILAYAQA